MFSLIRSQIRKVQVHATRDTQERAGIAPRPTTAITCCDQTEATIVSSGYLIVPFWFQANYLHLFRERVLIRTFSGEITDRKYRPPPKAVFMHTSLFVQVQPQIRYCGLSPKTHLKWTLFIQSTQATNNASLSLQVCFLFHSPVVIIMSKCRKPGMVSFYSYLDG